MTEPRAGSSASLGDRGRRRGLASRLAAGLLAITLTSPCLGQEQVEFASLDRASGGAPVPLRGLWFAAPRSPAPAVALFHGCSGAFDRRGQLSRLLQGYVDWLRARGFHALVVDSFGGRGEAEICTQRAGTRHVTQGNRRLDALAAVRWLGARGDVEPARIGLLGWSHGGSTVLAATNRRHRDVATAPLQPAFAVAFYPGCGLELRRGYEAAADLLLLVGEADDWTPAAPCHRLAESAQGRGVAIEGYAGAYHGFDSTLPLRLRSDVPNGTRPGEGVHVGGDPAAAARARQRLAEFLARH